MNKQARKTVGFSQNPFLGAEEEDDSESEVSETEILAKEHRTMMEDGGFTKVEEETFTKRNRGRDRIGTVFKGISLEELRAKESEKR